MLPIIAGIISSLIQNNLPKIAQAVADKGVDYVQDKLGVKLEPDMSAEKLAEIQAAATKHEEFVMQQDNENTANARAMQMQALQQDDVFSKRFTYYLASFWSIITTIYIFCITFINIPLTNVRFSDTILGFLLGSVIATLINFFFGSSKTSQQKTELLLKSKDDK